jgi:hypothetical protein
MCRVGSEELKDLRDRRATAQRPNDKSEDGKLPITFENMGSVVLSPVTTEPEPTLEVQATKAAVCPSVEKTPRPEPSPEVQATKAAACPGVEKTPRPEPTLEVQATKAAVCPGVERTQGQTDDFVIRCLLELKNGISATGGDTKKVHTTHQKSESSTGEGCVGENKDAECTLFSVAAKVSGNSAPVAQGAPAEKQFSVWSAEVNVHDTNAVRTILKKAETNGEINYNSMGRLQSLHLFLLECKNDGLLTFVSHDTPDSPLACILGWSKLLVKQPLAFNLRCRDLVESDQGGWWKHANGKGQKVLKNPTFGIYELFRKIGVKPHLRGPAVDDPGKSDCVYYREWHFRNDDSFRNARKRLLKGFHCCPDKGNRERKRELQKRSEPGAF